MSYYRTCPHCGAHLDPGELCDCPEARQGRTVYNFLVDYKDGGKDMHTAVQIAPEPIVEAATTPETATAYIVMQYALQRKLVTAVIHVPGSYGLAELVEIQESRRTLPPGSRFMYVDVDELRG